MEDRVARADRLHPVRHDRDLKRAREALLAERLGEEIEAVEAVLDVLVQEARARAEALGIGREPEVDDLRRRLAVGDELLDEGVVAGASELGGERVLVGAAFVIGVALEDADDLTDS